MHFRRRLLRRIPLKNLIRLAKWEKLDIEDKTDEEVFELVFWAMNYS